MLKVNDFIQQLKMTANARTLYVMGGFGAPAGYGRNRSRYSNNNPYNQQESRRKLINTVAPDTFFFDCVGLIKGTLWGFNRDPNRIYGGADYESNNVPDDDAKQMMFLGCPDAAPINGKPEPGEFLWFNGHCGVYLGDNKTIESTPSGSDGVQIRDFDSRWKYHGHIKYVDYSGAKPEPEPETKYHSGSVYTVQCTGPLRIRSGPTTDRAIVDNLYRGDKVLCDGTVKDADGNTWMRIIGYAAAEYDGEVWIK